VTDNEIEASEPGLRVRPFEAGDAERWDQFVRDAWNGTILHTRRYLSYHGDRFDDRSLLIEDDRGRVLGLFPAAIDPEDARRVISHPGITFGGVVHDGQLGGERMIDALRSIGAHYRSEGLTALRIRVVPYIYYRVPAADDLYALARLGATRWRCDLAAVIDCEHQPPLNRRRKRSLRKALAQGVTVERGAQWLPEIWTIITEVLRERHGARPTHTLEEIQELAARFPDEIRTVAGLLDGVAVTGAVFFLQPNVLHVQYSGASEVGREIAAIDVMFDHGITLARQLGKRYFSFGISTEENGRVLNESLYQFKREFGAGAVVHEFYELDLPA
jgi:hypothetical protein